MENYLCVDARIHSVNQSIIIMSLTDEQSNSLIVCFRMDDEGTHKVKKKRVLPEWMRKCPESKEVETEKTKPLNSLQTKSVVHIMSPYELEQVARQLLSEVETRQNTE